ncbi:hypothetical protein P7C73_g165, partial [Tremellales sp. Uapishka_1]
MSNPLSAPGSIDDVALLDTPPPTTNSTESHAPSSPKPRLLLDPLDPSSSSEGGLASGQMTLEDYKMLTKRTQQRGMVAGIAGGGVITYAARQYLPKRPSSNGLFLTFLLSSTFVSYLTSHTLLLRELSTIRAIAREKAMPQSAGGGGALLPDLTAAGDKVELIPKVEKTGVLKELEDLGKRKDRTRWAKGRGLDGEVEEEGEMRDTWHRPGLPRREV